MAFNPIADALCLLFVDIKPRNAPGHSYFGQHTDNRGERGQMRQTRLAKVHRTCYNCGIIGHKSADCFRAGGGAHKGKGKGGKGGKGTSLAITAKDGQKMRGSTLSSDERLSQLEDLLSKFELVGMSGAVESAYMAKAEELATKAKVDSGCTSNVCSLTGLHQF